jgi:hypothetical protein
MKYTNWVRNDSLLFINKCYSYYVKGSPVHVAPTCVGSGEGFDQFEFYVRSLSPPVFENSCGAKNSEVADPVDFWKIQ